MSWVRAGESREGGAPPRPPPGSVRPGASPPESRDGSRAGDTNRGAGPVTELRRARPGSGDSPAGGSSPGLREVMEEERGAKSMRSRAWEGVKEGANYSWR